VCHEIWETGPLINIILEAVSRRVDDGNATHEPSHSDIQFQIKRADLEMADPSKSGHLVGSQTRNGCFELAT
jgi:hypothetical protein